jgi:glyceraldehyde-3-phosphate dehydrogenase/erythrose-4-phosphate dehydrogenase
MNIANNNLKLKVIGFSVPTVYAERVDAITRRERRTKRAVFEAMVDLYEETVRKRGRIFRSLDTAVQEALREKKEQNVFDGEQWMAEWKELSRYGSTRAQALGITDQEVDALAYEGRIPDRRR